MMRTDTNDNNNAWVKYDFLVIATLLLAGLKFVFGLESSLDINIGDDVWYMFRGINVLDKKIPASVSPLYSMLYYAVWLVTNDVINTYYFVIKLVTILPSLVLYLLLRKNKINIILSAVVSTFFLISQMNFPSGPKVSHFAVIIMLAVLLLIKNRGAISIAMGMGALGSLVISYVRPEFFLAFFIFSLTCLAATAARFHKERNPSALLPVLIIIVSAAIVMKVGAPAFTGKGREIFAFGQHYSMNWVRWTNSQLHPMHDWKLITAENFGDSKSIKEAALANTPMFIKHIVYNTARFLIKPIKLASPYPLELTTTLSKFSGLFTLGMLGLYLIIIRRRISACIKNAWIEYKPTLIVMLIFSIPVIVSCILIYPRDHYMTIIGIIVLIALAMIISPSLTYKGKLTSIALTALIILLIVPVLANLEKNPTDTRSTINHINSLSIKEPIRILAAEQQYPPFINTACTNVISHSKNNDFDVFLKEQNINLIVLSPMLKEHPKFANDTKWKYFFNNVEDYGFSSITVPDSENIILVLNSIIETEE